MILLILLGSAFAASQNKNRPVLKKIAHLEKSAPAMINMYFIDAVPDPNTPAHANGPKDSQNRRERVAGRLSVRFRT